jgi:Holliday junction DNA helicase RuvA
MFAYIKGTLVFASPASVTIESGEIGYKIMIPVHAFNALPQLGGQLLLHTSFVVRELSQTLYGFLSAQERDFFEILMGVTGVGPKLALALIGHMPLFDLQHAIVDEDAATLCRIPGIGKKGAERLIIELRDKISSIPHSGVKYVLQSSGDAKSRAVNDALSALASLGYSQGTAQKAVKRALDSLSEPIELSGLIAAALTHV